MMNKMLSFGLCLFAFVILWILFFAFNAQQLSWDIGMEFRAPTWQIPGGYAQYGQPLAELIGTGGLMILAYAFTSTFVVSIVSCFYGFILASKKENSLGFKFMYGFLDIWGSIPGPILAGMILYAFGSSLLMLSLAFALASFDNLARFSWSLAKKAFAEPHYHADMSLGFSNTRLFYKNFIFDWVGPASAKFCTLVSSYIFFGTAAVIIGILDEQSFAWGALVEQGRQYFDIAPHVIFWGWGLILLTTTSLGFISSGIQRLFDRKIIR